MSVSSRRRRKLPPRARANSQLISATRALPTCSSPVGLGAKRTRTVTLSLRGTMTERSHAAPIAVRDRVAAITTDGATAALDAGGCLSQLVLRDVDPSPVALPRLRLVGSRHALLNPLPT